LLPEVVESLLYVIHAEGHVRDAPPAGSLDLPRHRRIRRKGLEELNQVGPVANLQQHLSDLIVAQHVFAMEFFEAHGFVGSNLQLQFARPYCDPYVIDEEETRYLLDWMNHS